MQETQDTGSVPGLGRSPGTGNGNMSQYRVELQENRGTTLAEFLLEQLRDPSHIVSTQYLLVN